MTSGPTVALHQAVTTFSPGTSPDFGAASFPTFELDPGVVGPSLDAAGLPTYAPQSTSPTTSGAQSLQNCMYRPLSPNGW